MIALRSLIASDPTSPLADAEAIGPGRSRPAGRQGALRPFARLALMGATAALAVSASGCASYMNAQVTTFHQAPASDRLTGQTFAIAPTAAQKDSLEFQAYADMVRQALIRRGLVDAPDASAALGVTMRYSADAGKSVVYNYPAYGYGGFGPVYGWAPYYGPRRHMHYAMTATYPIGYGAIGPGYYGQSVLYRRELRVDISDRRAGSNAAKLFEGTVVSEGESAAIAPAMPAMVQALFSDFPGPSGVSRRVQVRLDDRSSAASN